MYQLDRRVSNASYSIKIWQWMTHSHTCTWWIWPCMTHLTPFRWKGYNFTQHRAFVWSKWWPGHKLSNVDKLSMTSGSLYLRPVDSASRSPWAAGGSSVAQLYFFAVIFFSKLFTDSQITKPWIQRVLSKITLRQMVGKRRWTAFSEQRSWSQHSRRQPLQSRSLAVKSNTTFSPRPFPFMGC